MVLEPLKAIHFGWKHSDVCIQDDDIRRSVTGLFNAATGVATTGIVFAGGSLVLPHLADNLLLGSKIALSVAGIYSTRVMYDFAVYGREGLARRERLNALMGRRPQ